MKNYLPPLLGIALTKQEFCFCVGISQYYFNQIVKENFELLEKIGYQKYSKLLSPRIVLWLCERTGLQIDLDLYDQIHKHRLAYMTR